jgi:protein gp37
MGDLFHEDVPDQFIGDVFKVMDEAPHHTFQVLTKRPDRMRRVIQKLTTWHEHHIGGFSVQDWPLPNVWLGVSVENQWATWRVEELMKTPAAVRFISGEPLLGPLDLTPWLWGACSEHDGPGLSCNHYQCASARRIDWVIVGGESGPGRAERKLVERCVCKGQKEGHAESWVRVGKDDRGLPLYGGWHPKRGPEAWVLDLRNQCQAAGVPFFFKQWGGPRPTSGGRLLDGREWNEMPVGEP